MYYLEARRAIVRENILLSIYHLLYDSLGPSHWWPGESPFEICVGAILTQNTNWDNVERAINNLKEKGVLSPEEMYNLSMEELASLIRPAGYFNIKAKRLKNFLSFLKQEVNMEVERLGDYPLYNLREKLLSIKGIGPETADSMLLYAFEKPIFVVDAYTARIFSRHYLIPEEITYEDLQDFCHQRLDPDVSLYNEFHALLVRTGKNWCKKKSPRCKQCPLYPLLSIS